MDYMVLEKGGYVKEELAWCRHVIWETKCFIWLSVSTQLKNINVLLKWWWSSVRPSQGFGPYRRPPQKFLKWGSVKVAHQPKSDIGSSWIWLAHHIVFQNLIFHEKTLHCIIFLILFLIDTLCTKQNIVEDYDK